MEKLSEHITIDRVKANPAINLMQLFDHGMSGEELYDAFIDRIQDWVLKIDVHVATLATILLNTPNLPLLPHTLYLEIAEAVDTVLPNHPLYIRSAVYVNLVEVVHRHSQTQFEKTAPNLN